MHLADLTGRIRRLRTAWLGPLAVIALVVMSISATATAAPSPAIDGLSGTLSSYSGIIREAHPRGDGIVHVDTPASIRRLKQLHVTNYAYLIWTASTDWQDFSTEFAPAAKAAGIQLSVYLVPPSECCSQPYGSDFTAWGNAIGALSRKYDNIRAWAIDDVPYNQTTLTQTAMANARDAGRAQNPKLRFYAVSYYRWMSAAFIDTYAPAVDGFIIAYEDDPQKNTQSLTTLPSQMADLHNRLAPYHSQLILMVYAYPLYHTAVPPTPNYVSCAVGIGLDLMRHGIVDGLNTYTVNLDPAATEPASDPYLTSHSGLGRLSLQSWRFAAGGVARATTSATVTTKTPGSLSFWATDHLLFNTVAETGYLQVLVNGKVAGSWDVTTLPTAGNWTKLTVDLGSAGLSYGEKVSLSFQVYGAKDSSDLVVDTSVDEITSDSLALADPGAEQRSDWAFYGNNAYDTPDISIYDPLRPVEVFDTVARLFRDSGFANRNTPA